MAYEENYTNMTCEGKLIKLLDEYYGDYYESSNTLNHKKEIVEFIISHHHIIKRIFEEN